MSSSSILEPLASVKFLCYRMLGQLTLRAIVVVCKKERPIALKGLGACACQAASMEPSCDEFARTEPEGEDEHPVASVGPERTQVRSSK